MKRRQNPFEQIQARGYLDRMDRPSPEELRKQVIRRMRYALNVIAMESNSVPPEGPLDVAMTNGLAAIVASVSPTSVYQILRNGRSRILSAGDLIQVATDLGINIEADALREALDVTQPMRHGSADDEWVAPTAQHLEALRGLDEHPSLQVLELAASARNVDALLVTLFRAAAREVSGWASVSPDEMSSYLEPEECDECWRTTFLPEGFDIFGGTNTAGVCVACGHERSPEDAYDRALSVEWERWESRD